MQTIVFIILFLAVRSYAHFYPNISSDIKEILYENSIKIKSNLLLKEKILKLEIEKLSDEKRRKARKELKFILNYLNARLHNLSKPLLEFNCLISQSNHTTSQECRFIHLIHLLDYYADSLIIKPQRKIKYFSIESLVLSIRYLLNECSHKLHSYCESLADKITEVLIEIFYLNEATRRDGFFLELIVLILELRIKWLFMNSDRDLNEIIMFLRENFEILSERVTKRLLSAYFAYSSNSISLK